MKSEERQLLDAVACGDTSAFECIYRTYKVDLLTATNFLLRGDQSAAEDVLHDVFVSFARRAAEIQLTGTLRNYLLTSCLNRARDVLRQRRRDYQPQTQFSDEQAAKTEHETHSEAADESQRLQLALQLLPDEQREVVTLHIHGELTFREIAEMLGVSINTAQSRYRYALASLRKEMSRQATHED